MADLLSALCLVALTLSTAPLPSLTEGGQVEEAAFSRLGERGLAGEIPAAELPAFLALAAGSERAPRSAAQLDAVVGALHAQLLAGRGEGPYTIRDILGAARALAERPSAQPPASDSVCATRCLRTGALPRSPRKPDAPRGAAPEPGAKQLHKLRRRLEANRLTMPMFDTKGWVRDFEKALKAQWEVYANGLQPMHIVVARSDHVYGAALFDRMISGSHVS
ncbi:hypothetical protein T492DRAFT_909287 [Pavlovales sp. CCMP2436]|nr:hypothetical protein T492DRAFT_909287 [Pavlovales sp. CCMP2436]